jgi:hypothetical protein
MDRFLKLDPPVRVGNALIPLLSLHEYENNGRLAVRCYSLMSEADGGDGKIMEPWGDLSVNLPGMLLPDDGEATFFARSYDYHAETHRAMLDAGIIEELPGVLGNVGRDEPCTAAQLTPKAMAMPVNVDEYGNLTPIPADDAPACGDENCPACPRPSDN